MSRLKTNKQKSTTKTKKSLYISQPSLHCGGGGGGRGVSDNSFAQEKSRSHKVGLLRKLMLERCVRLTYFALNLPLLSGRNVEASGAARLKH